MNIIIKAIPEKDMRYATVGDWWFETDTLHIRVLDSIPENEQFIIALHELIEVWLCKNKGITTQIVDDFDFAWIAAHPEYPEDSSLEPGDDPACPYGLEHRFAMLIEHLMAHELGMLGYGVIR
jgi:hypothetical protein